MVLQPKIRWPQLLTSMEAIMHHQKISVWCTSKIYPPDLAVNCRLLYHSIPESWDQGQLIGEVKVLLIGFEAVRGLIPHIFLVRPGGHMCPPITLCCFFSSEFKLARKKFFLAFFQMLLSHWSIKIWLISPPYLRGLLNTFPKWYDTWNSDENWAFYGQKTEELCFCQKFWKNFRGLFGALKLNFFWKNRYFVVTLDRHYPILRSKSKSKKIDSTLIVFLP